MTTRGARKLPDVAKGVVSRDLGDEYVVLNIATNEAHALNGAVATVWRSVCDHSWPDLPDEQVDEAVDALAALGLLALRLGMTRRDMLVRSGALVAAAGIASIVLPEAAYAASIMVTGSATAPTTGTLTIPAGSHTINITVTGGGGGVASKHTGIAGGGGSVSWAPGVTLAAALTFSWNVGGSGLGTAGSPGVGGTGVKNGGAGSGPASDLGGGGGALSIVEVTGVPMITTGFLIAGGGGGAGDGQNGTLLGGNGGAGVSGTGAGGAGSASGGSGGTGGPISGTVSTGGESGVAGTGGTGSTLNGGGGGGSGYGAGGGGAANAAGGGGGGGGSSFFTAGLGSNLGGVDPTFGSPATPGPGTITWSYIT